MKKQILMIGIGQMGCSVADRFAHAAQSDSDTVHVLAVDTDARTEESVFHAPLISMAQPCKLGEILATLDTRSVQAWFPCDRENDCVEYFETLSMYEGANQWRMKALLAFNYFLSKPKTADLLHQQLDALLSAFDEADEEREVSIFVTASLAGGTGSGLFIPLILYIKRYLLSHGVNTVSATALLALPDICEELLTPEQRIKARANAYASMRELNAMNRIAIGDTAVGTLRIGHSDDPYFGLLYDSSDATFQTPENKPFSQVYLFRHVPGVRSVALHVDLLADAARSLCMEESFQPSLTTDAVYGGFSLSKAIYPLDSIVTYIARRQVYDIASADWMHLYQKASKELTRLRSSVSASEQVYQDIVSAVLYAADSSDTAANGPCALLGRKPDHFDADSDDHNEDDGYAARLFAAIDDEFTTSGSIAIDGILAADQQIDRKKAKNRFFGKKERRRKLLGKISSVGGYLQEYYQNALLRLDGGKDAFIASLQDPLSALSLPENLLKKEGVPLHPVYALVRLCAFYRVLDSEIEPIRSRNLRGKRELTAGAIPTWALAADTRIHMECKYDIGSSDRFALALGGNVSHVGGQPADDMLFCHDLKVSYARIRDVLRTHRIETALEVLGERITAYYEFFKAMTASLADLSADLEIALNHKVGTAGSAYYVGASQGEKRFLYDAYQKSLKESGALATAVTELDNDFSKGAFAILTQPFPNAEDAIRQLLSKLEIARRQACVDGTFYQTVLDKNILEVLLSQNGQNGADDADLALHKAFLARIMPLRYTLPDSVDGYLAARSIQTRVTAILPKRAEAYIQENLGQFGARTATAAVDQLLLHAGEYEGTTRFSDFLPANELQMQRETMGLQLSFIDVFHEHSEDPLYYKAYQKALMMKEEQFTELWDPHLIPAFSEAGALPPIAPVR